MRRTPLFKFPSTEEPTDASPARGHQLNNNTGRIKDHEFHHRAECYIRLEVTTRTDFTWPLCIH